MVFCLQEPTSIKSCIPDHIYALETRHQTLIQTAQVASWNSHCSCFDCGFSFNKIICPKLKWKYLQNLELVYQFFQSTHIVYDFTEW